MATLFARDVGLGSALTTLKCDFRSSPNTDIICRTGHVRKCCHEETLLPQRITALSPLAFEFFKGCNDGVELLDVPASSGF
jgi:hypothetical protein